MGTSGSVQLVIPMAGLGTRFSQSGFTTAKPLLPIHGQPMFLIVLANLLTDDVGKIVFVAQKSFGLRDIVEHLREKTSRDIDLIEIDFVTGGPADTVDAARSHLLPELPTVTANSDQYVDCPLDAIYRQISNLNISGSILTMQDTDPKWSYVSTDSRGYVTRVREKEVISSQATVGIYGFRSARAMWEAFDEMRSEKCMVNGEYFVAPAYNYLIARRQHVVTYDLGPIKSVMHGMGTPADYDAFLANPASQRAASRAQELFGL